jgi:hypothetical protein
VALKVSVVGSCYGVDVVVDWGATLVALSVCLDSPVEVALAAANMARGIGGGKIGFCGSNLWCWGDRLIWKRVGVWWSSSAATGDDRTCRTSG